MSEPAPAEPGPGAAAGSHRGHRHPGVRRAPGQRGAWPDRVHGRRGQPDLAGHPGLDDLEQLAQRLPQVGEQVLDVLDADRQPDQVGRAPPAATRRRWRASSGPGARSATPPRPATRARVNSRVRVADRDRLLLAAGAPGTTPSRRSRASARPPPRARGGPAGPGRTPGRPSGAPASRSATALGVVAVPVHPHGQRLEPAQRQPGVERPGDGAHRRSGGRPARSPQLGVGGDQRAADHVGVAAEVLRRGVHHRRRRPAPAAAAGTARRTCCPPPAAPRASWAISASAAMSAMPSSGLVGVSHPDQPGGRTASARAPRRGRTAGPRCSSSPHGTAILSNSRNVPP